MANAIRLGAAGTLAALAAACGGVSAGLVWEPPTQIDFREPESNTPSTNEDTWTLIQASRLVFVGEEHDNLAHHQVQASVARALADTGAPVIIALEMLGWDTPAATQAFSHGEIDLNEFLEASRWHERWGLGMEMYGPIIELAEEPNVTIVGINSPDGLSSAVFQRGSDQLSLEERLAMPTRLDDANEDYRAFVTGALLAHMDSPDQATLQRFYEAQLTWDQSMAGAIDSIVESAPEAAYVVVIAGYGHVQYDWGVPSRVTAIPRDNILTIVCASEHRNAVDADVADILCYESQ